MLRFLFVNLLVLVVVVPSLGQMPAYDHIYDAGRVAFDYAQTPFPFYSGHFEAEGPALDFDGTFPDDTTEVVGGGSVPVSPDTVRTAFYATVANTDGTFDITLVTLASEGFPEPGSYPVDTAGNALFAFLDDASSFDLPDTLDEAHLTEWITNLTAAHKLVSASGSITIGAADPDTLWGTFSGLTVDADDVMFWVNINDGRFDLSGADIPLTTPPADLAPAVQARPNPFNPRTDIVFDLPRDQYVTATVYDAAGRAVRTLYSGQLPAGRHDLAWEGCDAVGRRSAAGLYLVSVQGADWQRSVKVTLAP